MRRFRFPLDRVLKLRAHSERAARRALAEEMSRMVSLEGVLERVEHNLQVCQDDDSVHQAAALARALEAGLLRHHRRLEGEIVTAEQHVDAARQTYAEARVDHRAMSNLRSRRFEAWRLDAEREEQAEFDEIARTRFALRKRKN